MSLKLKDAKFNAQFTHILCVENLELGNLEKRTVTWKLVDTIYPKNIILTKTKVSRVTH